MLRIPADGGTLEWGWESCRDFAALFRRGLSLPRPGSLSGYSHAPATEHWSATAHAWTKVYLPGSGWKGFDPTSVEVTGNRHIAVAVARH